MPPLNMPLASLLLANALVLQMMAGAGAAAGSLHMHAAGPDTQYFCGDLGVPRWQRQRGPGTEATGAGGALPLLLPPAVGCPPEVLSLNAAVQPAPFEAAGASHQRLLRLRAGIADDEQEGSDAASTSRTASPNTATFDHDGLHGDDHYSVLGLGDLRWRATEDQVWHFVTLEHIGLACGLCLQMFHCAHGSISRTLCRRSKKHTTRLLCAAIPTRCEDSARQDERPQTSTTKKSTRPTLSSPIRKRSV